MTAPSTGEARRLKCAVAVAKLDGLSRDVAFVAGLIAQRVSFLMADLGAADMASSPPVRHMISENIRS